MKLIDGDALAEKVLKVKSEICHLAAGWVDEDSYECGAVDAFTDVLNYIEEAPDLGDQDPGRLREPAADPSEEGNG